MLISSPTINPPASSAAFQVSPKSLRLIFVVADTPIRVLPHGSFAAARRSLHRERHAAGHALDRQVARHHQLPIRLQRDVRRLQVHRRKLLGVEEVRALQMGIAALIPCVDRRNLDRGLHARLRQIRLIAATACRSRR